MSRQKQDSKIRQVIPPVKLDGARWKTYSKHLNLYLFIALIKDQANDAFLVPSIWIQVFQITEPTHLTPLMIRLATRSKLKIAQAISRILITLKKSLGQPKRGLYSRKGINWELDLDEGIDLSIYLFGAFEREVCKSYSGIIQPGMQVIDIGANIGAHTLPMAQLVGDKGQVDAFEPTTFAVEKLKRNLVLNPALVPRVRLNHCFLCSQGNQHLPSEGIPSSWNLAKSDAAQHKQHGGFFKPLGEVKTTTLDDYVTNQGIQRIDLIKLDVDGNELDVLAGARIVISKFKPIILMELAFYEDEARHSQLFDYLNENGYKATLLANEQAIELSLTAIRKAVPKNGSLNARMDPR
jgi:FkbM family methyltransferase